MLSAVAIRKSTVCWWWPESALFKADVDVDLGGIFGTQSSSATSTDLGIDLRGGAKYGLNENRSGRGNHVYARGCGTIGN